MRRTILLCTGSRRELKSYFDAGGTILFGTDVGYTQLYDTTSEFEYMARAGMSWRDILASMTTNPASFFKVPTSGRVEKGMDADLVVLAGDPANDVRIFANVVLTIRAGKIIYEKPQQTRVVAFTAWEGLSCQAEVLASAARRCRTRVPAPPAAFALRA